MQYATMQIKDKVDETSYLNDHIEREQKKIDKDHAMFLADQKRFRDELAHQRQRENELRDEVEKTKKQKKRLANQCEQMMEKTWANERKIKNL